LDPYGGAITGILGVNRDILGCGLGAKPIANMDVFCFSSPDWPDSKNKKHLPVGLKHPRRIFEGVHRGIEDGGNKSGIPTVNGAIYFDRDFAGKPLVFCGTVGFLPALLDDGTPTSQKEPDVGDRIIMIGGAIGADGIHGATMSSLELNEFSPATAVQIGDPLTQKRVLDFITHARDNMLYSSITDNGAGGLSSSVGEMAVKTNGATIDLSRPSVKYPGLSPYELMISESQERMTVAVPENKLCDFMSAAKKFGVVATDIGEFTDSGTLKVLYHNEIVANLNLDFLHESLPQMKLKARWDGPKKRKHWSPAPKREKVPGNLNNAFLDSALKKLLSSPNIASKESWVRRYDHEVQAATHIKPFMGKSGSGPSDSGVIWLYPHGGERNNAISIGCGLNPRLSLHDPYLMAQFAVDEALRNVIATGGDPEFCCLLDNFCWPDPVLSEKNSDGDYKLGQLVKTCQGLYDTCLEYGAPLVSGKDSMKNDFRGKKENGEEVTISVLPTLLVTAMAKTDVTATVTSPFKNEGDHIYLLGEQGAGLVGSEFCEFFEMESCLPTIDPKKNYDIYKTLHKEIGNKRIASCHDISDGGLLPCICESSFGNLLGAEIDLTAIKNGNTVDLLFNETPGRFVITVKPDHTDDFEKCFKNLPFTHIGQVSSDKKIKLTIEDKKEITFNIEDLLQSYGKWSSK
ncbi:MAG: hypothetical protein KAQ98_07145, partial [Bacteriovoracaceae bacterium]|nr:hypothetical protein [Bacteriovoracaceae bacterium]